MACLHARLAVEQVFVYPGCQQRATLGYPQRRGARWCGQCSRLVGPKDHSANCHYVYQEVQPMMAGKWFKPGTPCARVGAHVVTYVFTCADCAVEVEACEHCQVCITSCGCGKYQSIDSVTP